MDTFDYREPAELFVGKGHGTARGRPLVYKRFSTSAEALTYAVTMLDEVALSGSVLVIGDDRFEGAQIKDLYCAMPR
jgi:hypothetical protein